MEPESGHSQQQWRPKGGGQGGGQEPAIVEQPEGNDLHLEPILSGHAPKDALLQGRVHEWPQHAEVPREETGIVLNAVVLLPTVGGVEGAHGAREKDGGVIGHHHLFGWGSTLLQGCKKLF